MMRSGWRIVHDCIERGQNERLLISGQLRMREGAVVVVVVEKEEKEGEGKEEGEEEGEERKGEREVGSW